MINNSEMNDFVDEMIEHFDFLLSNYPEVYDFLKEKHGNIIEFEFQSDNTRININGEPFDFPKEK